MLELVEAKPEVLLLLRQESSQFGPSEGQTSEVKQPFFHSATR